MANGISRRRLTGGWVGGTLVVVMILSFAAFRRHRSCRIAPRSETPKVQAEAVSETSPVNSRPLLFGVQQNDLEGYDRFKWGSSGKESDQLVAVSDSEDGVDPILEKIIGPPGEEEDSRFLPDMRSAPIVHVFHRPDGNDIQYGFYKDQLAWVSVRMQGAYSVVEKELNLKYPQSVPYSAQSMGDGGGTSDLWEGVNFNGRVYRRGNSNTRIYLMMMADQDGNQRGLWMTYIPTFYIQEMRQAWWDAHKELEQERAAQADREANAVQNADGAKIQ
jgi:hypothetical protein